MVDVGHEPDVGEVGEVDGGVEGGREGLALEAGELVLHVLEAVEVPGGKSRCDCVGTIVLKLGTFLHWHCFCKLKYQI